MNSRLMFVGSLALPFLFGGAMCPFPLDPESRDGGVDSCPLQVEGAILEDLTLTADCGALIVDKAWVHEGATLTVEAGTVVEFDNGAWLGVGTSGYCGGQVTDCSGQIVAEGTEDQPIFFTSNRSTPAPGNWETVEIGAGVLGGSVFAHVVFEYGGGGGGDETAALTFSDAFSQTPGSVAIRNCRFASNAGSGLLIESNNDVTPPDFFAAFEGNLFLDNLPYSVRSEPNTVTELDATNTFDAPILVDPGDLTTESSWLDHGVDYVIGGPGNAGRLDIEGGLTFATGITLNFLPGSRLKIDSGSIQAIGVTFRGVGESPSAATWEGIVISGASGSSRIDNCDIHHAGGQGYVLGMESDHGGITPLVGRVSITNTDFALYGNGAPAIKLWHEGEALCPTYTDAGTGNTFDGLDCQ